MSEYVCLYGCVCVYVHICVHAVQADVVHQFYQKSSLAELGAVGAIRSNDTVLIDTGVIYFSSHVVQTLIELARAAPLDACCYLGVDAGHTALRVELYRCAIVCMCVSK